MSSRPPTGGRDVSDAALMRQAIEAAAGARLRTAPNPWVGAVVVDPLGHVIGVGATEPPGGRHAEIVALDAADDAAPGMTHGGTLVVTLEPCAHHGRTPPCVERVVAAGIARVVVGVPDPDHQVAGRGVAVLRDAGIDVVDGVERDAVAAQLGPYLHHRRTGRPFVVAKSAVTIDGGTAAPDGTSRWITSAAARADGHRLRAESQAIVVGAGTVRTDDPSLTVRHVDGPDPLRVVLGRAPAGARVHPCVEWSGALDTLLDELGGRCVLQVLVEGGAATVRAFHDAGLVDRHVVYVAPAWFGGADAHPMLGGPTAPSVAELWRGRFTDVRLVGDDLRVELVPRRAGESFSDDDPAPLESATPLESARQGA